MKIINKYLFSTVISYVLLVMLFLLGLQMFVEFMHEFPRIGEGNYGLLQVIIYVLLMLPFDIYQFFPMICLLGSMIALGLLAAHSELIVIRASGMSMLNIAKAVVNAAIFLLLLMVLIGEVISPIAQDKAIKMKANAVSEGKAFVSKQGGWLYSGGDIFNIKSVSEDGKLEGVTHYQFDDDLKLEQASFAKTGKQDEAGWILKDVKETNFDSDKISSSRFSEKNLPLSISPKLVGMIHIDTDQKTLFGLRDYIKDRVKSGLDVASYRFAFWQRIFAPFSVIVMILLAIPFVFGSMRSATMGFRMLVGIMFGFGFYILNQFVGPMSVVYQVPPVLAALLPSLVFATIGISVLFKSR